MNTNRRSLLEALLLSLLFLQAPAQTPDLDSVRAIYKPGRKDTAAANSLNNIARAFFDNDYCDSGLHYARQAILLSEELKYKPGLARAKVWAGIGLRCKNDFAAAYLMLQEAKALAYEIKNDRLAIRALRNIGSIFRRQDKRTDALENFFEALSLSEKIKDTLEEISNLGEISDIFYDDRKYEKALEYAKRIEHLSDAPKFQYTRDVITESLGYIYKALNNDSLSLRYQLESLHISENKKDTLGIANSYIQLGDFHESRARYNLAIEYFINADTMYSIIKDTGGLAESYFRRAAVYLEIGKTDSALLIYRESLLLAGLQNDNYVVAHNLLQIGKVYMKTHEYSKALTYLIDNLTQSLKLEELPRIAEAYYNLSLAYEKLNQKGEAFINMREYAVIKDSIYKKSQSDNVVALEAKIKFEKTVQAAKTQQEKDKLQAGIKIYSLMGGLAVLLLIAALLYRNNKQKQNAKTRIENAYEKLKLTQAQLIHSEKMASLGELTSGIAHEIQNPLNFVNNFSEINIELIGEMQHELNAGNKEEAIAISNDVKENQEKINHHGKRADAIVKGMLQHSRSSTGIKAPTDLNALSDEYMRLAYHGLRAKNKTFNATLKTEFDPSIGLVNIIPQDIGRAVLNLFANAFYAVAEKAHRSSNEEYEPMVSVKTEKRNGMVEVKVRDNGYGIPANLIDKIFQPFFTTKPTGQGTGLGLSLSYDIIKAHGGELKVETMQAEGATFIIQLPLKEII